MPQLQDPDFIADQDFTPDPDFIKDPDFTPDTSAAKKYKTVETRPGQFISVAEGETVEQARQRIQNRPDTKWLGGLDTIFDKARQKQIDEIASTNWLPEAVKPYAGMASSLMQEPARVFAEGLATPEGLISTFPGFLRKILGPPEPVIAPPAPPPPPPVIRGLLPERNPEEFVAGPGGVQRSSLVTNNPQEQARLLGHEVDTEGPRGTPAEPYKPGVDIGELRERERIRNLTYGQHEHLGGSTLTLPDRPLMNPPPGVGDTTLGFSETVPRSGELEYPLSVVPQAVQPRRSQTVMQSITPDRFAEPVQPPGPPTKFISGEIPPEIPEPPTRNLLGGTAAVEPGETILPSAVKVSRQNVKESTGLKTDNVVPVVKEATTNVKTKPEVKAGVTKGVDAFVKAAEMPSTALRSVYTQLRDLGAAGKNLVYRFQRAAQQAREYDAAWTEPLFKIGAGLSKTEHANFGAYVEGRLPIPNDRVKRAVEAWNDAQNMMSDMAVAKNLHSRRGKQVVPFEKIEAGYWPHVPTEVLKRKDIVDRLMAKGMSRYDAEIVALKHKNSGEIFIGPQHARLRDEFQFKDDFDVGIYHGRSMSRRIANHEHLGPKDVAGRGNAGIANLIEDTDQPDLALALARRLAGRDKLPSERLVAGLNRARQMASLSSLPNFSFPNVIMGQTMNAHMAVLSRHPLKAVGEITKLFKSAYRSEIRAAGVYNTFNRSLAEELQGIDPFQIGVGEKINRGIAAAIGRTTVRSAFNDYKAGVNVKAARYFLEELLSRDPDSIQAITPELERFAAGRMAEITQGLNAPGNLPYHWSDPVNDYQQVAKQLMLIFKKIGFQVTKTVKDTIKVDPWVAVPSWLMLTQVAGEMVGDVKSGLTGKERPEDLMRIVDNWSNLVMLGMPWDIASSAQYGPWSLAGAVAGPIIGKSSELAYDVAQTGVNLFDEENEDPWKPLRTFGEKNLPIPGRERIKSWMEEE